MALICIMEYVMKLDVENKVDHGNGLVKWIEDD